MRLSPSFSKPILHPVNSVFCRRQTIKRKPINGLWLPREPPDKTLSRQSVLCRVAHMRDQRDPHMIADIAFRQDLEVLKYQLIPNARHVLVQLRVHALDIIITQINMSQDPAENSLVAISACVQIHVNPVRSQPFRTANQELILHCCLTAGERDSTPGDVVCLLVFQKIGTQVMIRPPLSDDSPRPQVLLGFAAQTLWIMAPLASQRASFQENGNPHAGSIVDRKLLYVKNRSVHTLNP